jgi:hypothetical protein
MPSPASFVADGAFRYRPEVLAALAEHGIRPTSSSPPDLVRGFVRDLYKYEIRRLRDRLLAKAFPRAEYADRVLRLRERYGVLTLVPGQFLEVPRAPEEPGGPRE